MILMWEHWDRTKNSSDLYRVLKMNWIVLSMLWSVLMSLMGHLNYYLLRMIRALFVQEPVHLEIWYVDFVHFLASFVLSLLMSMSIGNMKENIWFFKEYYFLSQMDVGCIWRTSWRRWDWLSTLGFWTITWWIIIKYRCHTFVLGYFGIKSMTNHELIHLHTIIIEFKRNLTTFTIDDELWSKCISVVLRPIGTMGALNIQLTNVKDIRWSYLAACCDSCSSFFRCSISTVCNISLIVDM